MESADCRVAKAWSFSPTCDKNGSQYFPSVKLRCDLESDRRSVISYWEHLSAQIPALTFPLPRSNNPPMPRPDAIRRVKSYSAADGYVYQYYFFEGNRAQRNGSPGGEFTYVVSADRRTAFPFKIFVIQSALDAWAQQNGRPLSSSEEYAVAKMRLFQAFDEGTVQAPAAGRPDREVIVDESNLEDLLGRLGI